MLSGDLTVAFPRPMYTSRSKAKGLGRRYVMCGQLGQRSFQSSVIAMDDSTFMTRFYPAYRSAYDGALPTGFTALDFVGALGSVSGALLYSRLLLPEFVEVDGMILLKDVVDDLGGPQGVRARRPQYPDAISLEQELNTFCINLNFPNSLKDSVEGDDRLLAEQLALAWKSRLCQVYPNREFATGVIEEEGEASVFFHQLPERNRNAGAASSPPDH